MAQVNEIINAAQAVLHEAYKIEWNTREEYAQYEANMQIVTDKVRELNDILINAHAAGADLATMKRLAVQFVS